MKCLHPTTIRAPAGYRTALLDSPTTLTVPCGRCYACLSNLRNEWSYRLQEESRSSEFSYFITLTYSPENLEYNFNDETGELHSTINKITLQKFIKRLRKHAKKSKIRYYAIGEYGSLQDRPHYHILLYSNHFPINTDLLQTSWTLGHISIYPMSDATIHYVTKYHLIRHTSPLGSDKPFALMSRKPGIGHAYLKNNQHIHNNTKYPFVTTNNGMKQAIPRYYKNKLFTDENGLKVQSEIKTLLYQRKTLFDTLTYAHKMGIDAFQHLEKLAYNTRLMKHQLEHKSQLKKGKL